MTTHTLHRGNVPLLISLPHDGSAIPPDIAGRMTEHAQRSIDTDWHVSKLYEPLAERLGASLIKPLASRYVVDLNRPSDGQALYPGRKETGLVPTIGFDGEVLYREGQAPDAQEVQRRIDDFWRPYHQALAQELARLRFEHGRVLLWEGHSIRSRVPMLFDGQLPDFNLGTADGRSCRSTVQQALDARMQAQSRFSHVVNGRFKGGYITRHYGQPDQGVDAVQLELSQVTYMDEDSFVFESDKAAQVQDVIGGLLEACLAASKDDAAGKAISEKSITPV